MMTRLSMSRPSVSVPKGCSNSGGCSDSVGSWASGSYGASSGAMSATSTISRSTTAPITAPRLRTKRRSVRRNSLVSARTGAVESHAILRSRVVVTSAMSAVADARIEERISQINHQVEQEEDGGGEQDHARDHRKDL